MGIAIRNTSQGGRITFRGLGLGGRIASGWPVASTSALLLDLYPGAAAAYSLRKLRSAYAGSAIRVRRAVDNSETNIGFNTNNQLDETSLLDFVNAENYCLYSENYSSNWVLQGVSVTANVAIAPDGTNTANNLILSTATSGKTIYRQLQPPPNGVDNVYSIYVKANGYNYAYFNAIAGISARYAITVDLTNGTITQTNIQGSPNFINTSVTSIGNGWYRLVITLNITAGNCFFAFSPSPVSNPTVDGSLYVSNAGNGTSGVLFWGAQLNYFTLKSYAKTTSVLLIGSSSGFVTTWYDQSGNTRNITQTTAANQPLIVNAGTIQTINSKPAVYFDTTAKNLSVAYGFPGANSFIFDVLQSNDLIFVLYHGLSNGTYLIDAANSSDSNTTINYSATVSNYYKNGALQTSPATRQQVYNLISTNTQILLTHKLELITWSAFNLSGYTSYEFVHYKNELVIYNTDQTSNRSAIESNINSFYSIY